MAGLVVRVRIPDPQPEDRGSVVRVVLRDTTMADVLHPTVAEATGVMPVDDNELEVTIQVPEEGLDRRRRYSVWAHVDHSGNGQLQRGDLITTQNVSATEDDIDAEALEVPLTRI